MNNSNNNSLLIKNIQKKKISKILSPGSNQLDTKDEGSEREGKISKDLRDNLAVFNSSFKILILDSQTIDIISVLFKIADLREHNICAHYLISNSKNGSSKGLINRRGKSSIPAIYYISSFEELIEDVCKLNYSSYSITSSYQIKRRDLENLGIKISELKEANRILQIQDSFTNFITLQNDLFILNLKKSFTVNYIPEIVSGLFSFFTTIDQRPVIITRGPREQSDLRENSNESELSLDMNYSLSNNLYLKIRNMKFIKRNNLKKPILLMVDRNIDLITPCLHVMGYLEIINDIFDFNLNKIKELNDINIDTELDFFVKNRFNDFPTVVSVVEEEVVNYKKDMAMHGNALGDSNDEDTPEDVGKMLDSAPELQKKSEVVSSYLNLCTRALEIIKNRKLDDFYTMEQNFNKEELSNLISTNEENGSESSQGNDKDIIRLCLSMINTKHEDLIKPILETRKIKTNILDFVKNRMFNHPLSSSFESKNISGGASMDGLNNFKNNSTIFKGIKDFLFKKEIPVVTYIEDIISKIKNGTLEQNYNAMDTSSSLNINRRDSMKTEANSYCNEDLLYWSEVSSVIVFFTGGGASYTEFKKIKQLENKYNIPFIVGATEMVNAENFLKELEKASI